MKQQTGVIGIDLGAKTGIVTGRFDLEANWDIDRITGSATVERFELIERDYLLQLEREVKRRMYAVAPDPEKDACVIVVPVPTFGRKTIARHWKMIGVIERLAQEHGNCTVIEVIDNHIRKMVLGTQKKFRGTPLERRAERKRVSMFRYGLHCNTDDEADALMFVEWYLTCRE